NACIKDKRFAEALQSYDSALALEPDQVGALTDRCVALAEMDRFDEALAAADQALRISPHVVAAHVNRGNALIKLARLHASLVNAMRGICSVSSVISRDEISRRCSSWARSWLALRARPSCSTIMV